MRKAFTLIELLVVIAIIAILAAILFPVFAQAKAAAKGAASISNAKQHVLAIIMYGSDNEDYLPLGTAWHTGNDPLAYGCTGCSFSTWGWAVQPYMKSGGLFNDPLASPNAIPAGFPADVYNSYYSMYGYNYTYLSPFIPDTGPEGQHIQSVSQTAPGQPTQTVMIVSKWANAENQSGFDWGTGFPGGMLFAAASETPFCATIPQYCATNWGVGGFYDDAMYVDLGTDEAGQLTGGNSRRSTQKHVVGWGDGHASKLAASALAVGTNWTETIDTGDVDVTSCTSAHTFAGCGSDTYLWDIE